MEVHVGMEMMAGGLGAGLRETIADTIIFEDYPCSTPQVRPAREREGVVLRGARWSSYTRAYINTRV